MNIYLLAHESKDKFCLAPVADALSKKFKNLYQLGIEDLGDEIEQFTKDPCPVAVFTSLSAYYVARFIRGDRPFVAIGLEHGVAPFKDYTFNEHFLNYDAYISPTELWQERLKSLFPESADKFVGVAYPRLDDLAERIANVGDRVHEAWGNAAPEDRDLVIFSWGVDFDTLTALPDREGIVYLVHPAMAKRIANLGERGARIVASTPEDASLLLANAHRVFGDFSSMTLEAAALKPNTYMFVERRFYSSDCGIIPSFFEQGGVDFGRIAKTDVRLPAKHILSQEGLEAVLSGAKAMDPKAAIAQWSQVSMLPAHLDSQCERAAELIYEAAKAKYTKRKAYTKPTSEWDVVQVVEMAYTEILGRRPDPHGLLHHARALMEGKAPYPTRVMMMLSSFAQSQEALARWATGDFKVKELKIST